MVFPYRRLLPRNGVGGGAGCFMRLSNPPKGAHLSEGKGGVIDQGTMGGGLAGEEREEEERRVEG